MSLQFLSTKSWHVHNQANQKAKFLAEEKARETRKAQEEKAREREEEYHRAMLKAARAGGNKDKILARESVDFMYTKPPGFEEMEQREAGKNESQGDNEPKKDKDLKDEEKFPVLKNAPKAGSFLDNLGPQAHKPFGVELRNVKCIKCGQWGHQTGDRVCPSRNLNPQDGERQHHEDPASRKGDILGNKPKSKLVVRRPDRSPIRGNCDPSAENQQLLLDEPFLPPQNDDLEAEVIASLSSKQRRKLMKRLEKRERKLEKKEKKGKKEKKEKKEKRSKSRKRSRSPISTSSSSDSSYRHRSSKQSRH